MTVCGSPRDEVPSGAGMAASIFQLSSIATAVAQLGPKQGTSRRRSGASGHGAIVPRTPRDRGQEGGMDLDMFTFFDRSRWVSRTEEARRVQVCEGDDLGW